MRTFSTKTFFYVFLVSFLFCGCARNISAVYQDGVNAFNTRDFRRAINYFTEVTTRDETNVDSLLMLARANLEFGDLPAASNAIKKAEALSPNDLDIIEFSGQLAYHMNDIKKMCHYYEKLIATSNSNEIRSRGYCALALADILELKNASNQARARVNLLTAIQLDPKNPCARYHLARLYRDSYSYNEAALDQFMLYVRLEPEIDDRVRNVQRRVIPDLQDSIVRAATTIPGVNKRDCAASAKALKRADAAWAKGNFKTARSSYNEAYSADPLSFPAAIGLAKSWEKTDSSRAGQREAMKYYKRASQINSSSRDALLALGSLAAKSGNNVLASEAYSRLLTLRPTDISALNALITALNKSNEKEVASVYKKYCDNLQKKGK